MQAFHGFEIRDKIGSGGMSTVYRGIHQTLEYPVAIKILHPALAHDENFIVRFEREARAASSLRSNNIVSVIDFGTESDTYFIVMEYVDGPDLSQSLGRFFREQECARGIPVEIALILVEEAAYGLQEAHAHSIIHRDVKPSNILLNINGEVKIADFGLARDTGTISPLYQKDLTMTGMVVGTPSYMSPEQAAGTDKIDHRTDIFALGVVAYQLLAGRKPFTGSRPSEVQENIINQPPPPLDHAECPLRTPEIDTLLAKMLAKDPAHRYQSMEQVCRGVQAAVDSIDVAGNVGRYRRDYLKRFVADPRVFAEEICRQNITDRLKRGYHFKEMGLSNIADAVQEFGVVLALDPQNTKANDALFELRKKAEESGVEFPVVASIATTHLTAEEATRVGRPVPPASERLDGLSREETLVSAGRPAYTAAPPREPAQPSPPTEPPPPPRVPSTEQPASVTRPPLWRRKLPIGSAVLALLALVFVVIRLVGQGEDVERGTGEVSAVSSANQPQPAVVETVLAVPVRETETALVETVAPDSVVTDSVATEIVGVAPSPTPVPGPGVLGLTSDPSGASVYLRRTKNDSFELRGTTPWTDDLEAGSWEIRIEFADHEGQSHVLNIPAEGHKNFHAELEPIVRGPGWLKVVAVPYADIYLDGELKKSGEKLAYLEATSDRDHAVEFRRPALFGVHRVEGLRVAPGRPYR